MGKIVFFEEDEKRHGVFRFVCGFRKRSWFRKGKVAYSLDPLDAECRYDYREEIFKDIEARIKADYPHGLVYVLDFDEFINVYNKHRFFAICRWKDGVDEYYIGEGFDRKATYSPDIEDCRMMFSESSAFETLRTIQQTTRDRVYIRTIYLDLVNELLTPIMMITCTSKSSGETKYFRKLDGNRVRLVETSGAATKFTYESVLRQFEYLQQNNKNYLYAVLPVFKDNVNCKNIENYMKENKVSRMIVMDLQLKHLNR